MKQFIRLCCIAGLAQGLRAQPALTVYNQNFAVVRDTIHLDLKEGTNTVNYNQAAMHLEPDSVVLRDPAGKHPLRILEQNFRADPVSQALLLNYYEGKTIQFETQPDGASGKRMLISGKIIRSGYIPQSLGGDEGIVPPASEEPIIEVDGKMMFRLPGEPLFPALPDEGILKPALNWQLQSSNAGPVEAELSYITTGMKWEASYNLVAPEKGEEVDLTGWVTINNQSGKGFTQAKIKLIAGDVNKIQESPRAMPLGAMQMEQNASPAVEEKAFDEYHLYTLARPTTLMDRQTKQVEFVHAEGIHARTLYVFDGAKINGYGGGIFRRNSNGESTSKVSVMREFTNSAASHLGLPLPKGRLRFYRRDADGQMEFTGENMIDHTPRDEVIRVTTGDSFDLTGERTVTAHESNNHENRMDETIQIELRNHKKEEVEIQVVEHLYRSPTWSLTAQSDAYHKRDAQTIEFPVRVKPDGKKVVTYSVHYTW